jgi:electron transfer flavoprotein beta subunit
MAQLLGIPQITYVDKVELDGKKVVARKTVDEGYEMLEARMPVLLTFMTPSDFVPTNPPFSKISKAQKKPLETWGVKEVDGDPEKLGLKGSFTTVTKVYSPAKKENAVMLEGGTDELAKKLADILAKEGFF